MHNFINKDTDVIIKEDNVSSVLSCPTESNIQNIIKYVQKNTLNDSYRYIYNIVNKCGISVQELITYIYEYYNNLIINEECVDDKYRNLINRLAIINENLTYCNNENIQLISLVSIFYM
jgi:DNA polymerase III gamma/tau subunit